jgi:DNA-binding GntR family transcriptional regulator
MTKTRKRSGGDGSDREQRASPYDQIKEAILTGVLKPMERIAEAHLAERLGLSRTPIREAFGRLAAEGLIVVVPQRGSFVSQLSLDHVLEIYQIRMPLECMAARIAAEMIDEPQLAELGRRLGAREAAPRRSRWR